MGTGKKEAVRKERQGKTGDGMANVKVKGENFYRDAKKIKTLNMFKDGKAQRNASGKITKAASYQSRDKPVARIEPNRKWFTNTRVIAQDSLAQFREAVTKSQADPYSYLLKQNKLPMSLIHDNKTKDGVRQHAAKIAVETAPFKATFGPKAQRKRVKMAVGSLEDMAGASEKMHDEYLERREQAELLSGRGGNGAEDQVNDQFEVEDGNLAIAREAVFSKGQSKRIWNELYKVIDSSDVVIHVLDARDPDGTRCRSVEKYIKEEAPHKHLLFVLNKCDLVPTSVAASWVKLLSKEYPTLAFRSSITNSFGKGSLIQLLRQFSILHSNRKQISVGLIGYPNTGKSSIINTLRKKKVCTTAPIPGETKVWQYITLMKRIYLIDSPGIVPPNSNDTEEDILLKGVVRVENVANPHVYVEAALRKCKRRHVERTYDLAGYEDATDFLEQIARKGGRLLKGGEADLDGVAKMVLNDFLRGKLPWFTPPPSSSVEAGEDNGNGQMPEKKDKTKADVTKLNQVAIAELREKKRKRDDDDAGDEDGEDVRRRAAGHDGTAVGTRDTLGGEVVSEDQNEDEDEDQDESGEADGDFDEDDVDADADADDFEVFSDSDSESDGGTALEGAGNNAGTGDVPAPNVS